MVPHPRSRPRHSGAAALAVSLVLLSAAHAAAGGAASVQVVVPGSANPNLADRAGGYTCCNGDSSPPQDAVLADGLDLEGCDTVSFSVLGRVSYLGGTVSGHNPDGDNPYTMINYGDGLSAPESVRENALLGVFLDESSPTGRPTPPSLDFSAGLGFSSLEPALRQIFFIGDGLTTDSAASLKANSARGSGALTQHFLAPPGAERLYLGTVDGEGWYNNSGSFQVEVVRHEYDPPIACGDAAGPDGILASDSLEILRGAVGTESCSVCWCDVDHSGAVLASDALAVLRRAVGQNVDLECPCCQFGVE